MLNRRRDSAPGVWQPGGGWGRLGREDDPPHAGRFRTRARLFRYARYCSAMSQANVEIVREIMELFNDPGAAAVDRLRELFADDVHIDMSRRVFNPDTYDGHEGL